MRRNPVANQVIKYVRCKYHLPFDWLIATSSEILISHVNLFLRRLKAAFCNHWIRTCKNTRHVLCGLNSSLYFNCLGLNVSPAHEVFCDMEAGDVLSEEIERLGEQEGDDWLSALNQQVSLTNSYINIMHAYSACTFSKIHLHVHVRTCSLCYICASFIR